LQLFVFWPGKLGHGQRLQAALPNRALLAPLHVRVPVARARLLIVLDESGSEHLDPTARKHQGFAYDMGNFSFFCMYGSTNCMACFMWFQPGGFSPTDVVLCLKTLTPTACVSRANLRHRDSSASVSKRHASNSAQSKTIDITAQACALFNDIAYL
jgi:hypothetical protein